MKVLHIIPTLSTKYGGPAKACLEMCRGLVNAGIDVSIYTLNYDYPDGTLDVPLNKPVLNDGIKIHYFPIQFKPYLISLKLAQNLSDTITNYDLIHIHGLYRFPQTIAAYYARKYKVPYIIRTHGSLDPFLYYRNKNRLFKRMYEKLVEFKNLNNAAAIHYTTKEEMLLTDFLNLKSRKIVIPLGIEPAEYENLPQRGSFRNKYNLNDKLILLHLGRINFKKGLDILVKSFIDVSHQMDDVFLVIAGPDNEGYRKNVDNWLQEGEVRDKVIFTGMIEGKDKLSLLRDADIFALPSYSENFGLAVVEAMACSLPVVISDKVNIWREVLDAKAGIVTSCDANLFSQALIELIENKNKRKTMGTFGKNLVKNKFNWKLVINALIKEYDKIINDNIK